MIKAVIPALLVATMAVGPASASYYNGNDMYAACRRDSQIFLMGYTMGVVDALANYEACIPEEATVGQLVDVVCQYIKNNPSRRHVEGESLVFFSIRDAFPCKK